MRYNILIAGSAGQGINEISNILGKSFAFAGYFVFNYREYESRITGGHNFNILSISDEKINSYEKEFDFVIALNTGAVENHRKFMKKNCVVIASQNYKINNLVKIEIENKKIENVYYAAALFKIFGFEKEILKNFINKIFRGKQILEEDLSAVDRVYEKDFKINLGLKKNGKPKYFFTGAEIIGIASIESGLQVYFAYPMTPATSLLSFFAKNQEKYNYIVYQPENEIAVANAGLGSSFSGAISMIGTSGGGFDLMTEALSMQGQAEIPLVVYLAQRAGPSTGVPTFSMQSDLNVALYGGHGEFPRIVVAPGDLEESYRLTKEIFYLSEKYKSLGIILTDKHLAESSFTIENLKEYKINLPKIKKILGKDLVKTSSYEHDENGNTTENPEIIKKRFDTRLKKWEEMKKEISKLQTYSVYGTGKKVLIGTGSVKGAVIDALKNLGDWKYIQINYLMPFANIEKEIKGKNIFVIEENSTGMLADLIQKNFGIKIEGKHRILKYDARNFTASEIFRILERIK